MGIFAIDKLMHETRRIAREYRQTTGKHLPVTAELAVNDAIKLLGLTPKKDSADSYDAVYEYQEKELKVIIKGRAIFDETKGGYRLGSLKLHQEWDAVLLVIMNADYETEEILLAHREDVLEAIEVRKENKRGSLSLSCFRNLSTSVWDVLEQSQAPEKEVVNGN